MYVSYFTGTGQQSQGSPSASKITEVHVSNCPLPSHPALRWLHNEHDCVSNHQPHDCLLKHLFRCRSKKTSKLRVIGLCAGNQLVTVEFPAQRASNTENVSIWWRHHGKNWIHTLHESTVTWWYQHNKSKHSHIHLSGDMLYNYW